MEISNQFSDIVAKDACPFSKNVLHFSSFLDSDITQATAIRAVRI